MRHTFQAEQWLPYPIDIVFAFFSDPENLPRLMPEWQRARIEEASIIPAPSGSTPTHPTSAGTGSRITLTFRPLPYSPIRISWEAEIAEFAWNDRFCDTQLRGPFAYWHHCHRLRSAIRTDDSGVAADGTHLQDRIEYELPCGFLGDLANRLLVTRQLRAAFAYRHHRTRQLLSLESV